MEKIFTLLCLSVVIIFTYSCANQVSKHNYPIFHGTHLSEANITILNKNGLEVFRGNTPASIPFKASSGFYANSRYQVTFEKEGFGARSIPVEYKVDGWKLGNQSFSGLVGLLIIDSATGGMYKLDTEFLDNVLILSTASLADEELKVFGITEIPTEWRKHLVALDQ